MADESCGMRACVRVCVVTTVWRPTSLTVTWSQLLSYDVLHVHVLHRRSEETKSEGIDWKWMETYMHECRITCCGWTENIGLEIEQFLSLFFIFLHSFNFTCYCKPFLTHNSFLFNFVDHDGSVESFDYKVMCLSCNADVFVAQNIWFNF